MQSRFVTLWVLVLFVLGHPVSLCAEQRDRVVYSGRYVTVQVIPDDHQVDPLQSIIDVHIPARIETLGRALNYVLTPYGFRLGECVLEGPAQAVLFMLPLPKPHRHMGPLTLRDALSVLGGEGFTLRSSRLWTAKPAAAGII